MPKQLIDFIFSPYRRQMLAVLLLRPDEQFHVRALERLTNISAGSLHRELKGFADAGLLTRAQRGNQVLYQADRTCPLFEELASILRKTVGLASVLREALQPIEEEIEYAFVFGSMASGKQSAESDVDICVLGDLDYLSVVRAINPAQKELHREINSVVMPVATFVDRLIAQDRFTQNLKKAEKIFLVGDEREFAELAQNRAA